MAVFKFFSIGKANEEISRLETALAASEAKAKTSDENAALVEAEAEKLKGELTQANADLATAKTSIESLTARATKAEADLAAANTKLANPSEQIKEAASRKALEITQAQGQPPIVSGTPAGPAAGGDVLTQYKAIRDGTEKVLFYRKNKAAIDAACKNLPEDFTWSTKPTKN